MNIKRALLWGGKAFLYQAWPLTILIGLNYLQGTIVPQSFLSFVFYLTTLIGHYALLLFLLYILLYLPVILIVRGKEKISRAWGLFIIVFFSFVHFIDSFIFAQYRFHFNAFIFDLLFGGAATDIFDFSFISLLMVFGTFIILTILLWFWGRKLWSSERTIPFRTMGIGVFLSLLISNTLHIYADASGKRDVTKLTALFPIYHPATSKRLMKKAGLSVEKIKIETEFNDFYYPLKPLECGGEKNPNILFVVIDSWRQDEFNAEITPHLFASTQNAQIFKHHLSGSNNTRGGIFNIFYGLPSNYWDVALQTKTSPVFVDELVKRQYATGIFSSASLASPEFDQTVFAKIPNLRVTTEGLRSHHRDLKINQEWKQWLQDHIKKNPAQPFFGFLFYDSPHAYKYPDNYPINFLPNHTLNYLALNNETDPLPIFNRHRNSVHFTDSLIKEVIHDLKAKKLLENTIIVFTGDHGQEFNDYKKNYWGHNSNFGHAQLHVPFILMWPGEKAQMIEKTTSHYDIVPTFMQKAWNCSNAPTDYSFGSSLFDSKVQNWHLVTSYLTYGILDLEKQLITVLNPTGDYENLDFSLNEAPKDRMRKKLVFDAFQEMNRFHRKN